MRVSATALLSLLFVVLVTAIYGQTTNTQCPVGPDSLTDNFPIDGATVPQICIGGFGLNQSEDYDRCFYIYVPDCAGPDSPLVFDIHGRSSCPLLSTTYTLWAEKATENCFVVVWPLGIVDPSIADSPCFSTPGGYSENGLFTPPCCCAQGGEADFIDAEITDDPSFLRAAAKRAVEEVPILSGETATIDTKRIYMAGHSNGCILSMAMASKHSDMVSAVCCHAGMLITEHEADYDPVPIWTVHGTLDTVIPYDGLVQEPLFFPDQLSKLDYFGDQNGCDDELFTDMVFDEDGNNVGNVTTRAGCINEANATLLTLFDIGHVPYRGVPQAANPNASTTTLDTTQMAWDFCSSFSKATAPDFGTEAPTITPIDTPVVAPTSPEMPTNPTTSAGAHIMKTTMATLAIAYLLTFL